VCHAEGEAKRHRVGLYHPPSNASVIAHNLKSGGFRVAWELMQPGSVYDHRRCRQDWPNSPAFGAGGSRRPWFNRGRGRGRKLAIL